MIENALWEGLTRGVRAEISCETEGLHDWQMSLDVVKWSTNTLFLRDDVTTTLIEYWVDTGDSAFGTCDLDEVDGFLKSGLGSQDASVKNTTSSGDDLSTTSVDGISVKGDIKNLEADSSHVLFTENTFLGGPLESSDERVLDFVEVLNSLGLIEKKVGSGGVGTEAPDLTGIGDIPGVVVGEETSTILRVVSGGTLSPFDGFGEAVSKGLSLE